MDQNFVSKIGWLASLMTIAMYFSYIDQIRLNLSGNPGSVILPSITFLNCIAWTFYGFFKEKKDWPIIVCNIPGIILGAATAITALKIF
ncbi:MAG: SemiSWEET family transporter [Candidatus Paceibacterota bacterium]